ncbi:MAG: phospho-N-acetylmuramoyl-pentapeptide-transferase [Anaerolineae bacterium]|nr:phospho-N-acetylmuramoyl-pentapeptide-transferase [Anaerolineae bacterium]
MYPWSTALTLSTVTFLFTVIWGRSLVRWLKRKGIGKQIRVDGPQSHQVKMGTPTMGGWLFIAGVVIITVALNIFNLIQRNDEGRSILLPLVTLIVFGFLGAVDDWEGIKGKRIAEGLTARTKFTIQVLLAAGIGLVLYYGLDIHSIALPGVEERINIGLIYIPLVMFIVISTSNAMNLTDGLDGLASSIAIVAFAAYGGIAYLQGPWTYLVQFCFIMVGALMAFMWFNIYPAQLFMGDTGSQALGATLGVVALMTGQWLLLPLIAIIPVAEALSSMIQVSYFKLTKRMYGQGRRVFRMAPLHHHFEMLGWSETHTAQRFWIVNLLSAMLGIALALL